MFSIILASVSSVDRFRCVCVIKGRDRVRPEVFTRKGDCKVEVEGHASKAGGSHEPDIVDPAAW